jgi:ERCC4-type nuclease
MNLIFERKAFTDLASSMKDGRYKEQKSRILSECQPRYVTYVIEEMPSPKVFITSHLNIMGLSNSTFMGFITHTLYRDGIHVFLSDSIDDTAYWLWMCAIKLCEHPEKFDGHNDTSSQLEYHQCVKLKTKKIENITPQQCYIMQLCQIPYVSSVIAKNIASVYPTMKDLYVTLGSLSMKDQIKALVSLPKVGEKKAQSIVTYLFSDATKEKCKTS